MTLFDTDLGLDQGHEKPPATDAEVQPHARLVYDPDTDPNPVPVIDFPAKDRKRWARAENWGRWLAYPEDGALSYHEVFMLRLSGRVRFVGRGGKQYGPQHATVVAATYWAFAHGWRDPDMTPEFNVHCQMEMRRGGAESIDLPHGEGLSWRPVAS